MNHSEQKKRGYTYKREDLYTVIVFCKDDKIINSLTCLKYRNVAVDKPTALQHFKNFITSQHPSAKYMNVYGGMSGDYYKRIYF